MAKYQEFKLEDFSGGYSSTETPDRLKPNQICKGSLDVQLSRTGAVEKRRGYSDVFTDGSTTWTTYNECVGLAQFYDPANTRWLTRIGRDSDVGSGTNAIRVEWCDADLGAATVASNWKGPVTLGSSSTAEQYVTFASDGANGRLYYAHPGLGTLNYFTYSGAALANNTCTESGSTRTLDLPKGVELWYDRVWCFCDQATEKGNYLLWSNAARTTFDLDNDFQEIMGEGPIVAIKRIRERLLVFKQRSMFLLSGGDDPTNNLRIDQFSNDVGCIAPRTVVSVEDEVYWLSDKGIYKTDGVTMTYLSKSIEEEIENIKMSDIEKANAVHNRKDSQVAFFVPVLGDATGGAWGSSGWGSAWGGGAVAGRALVYDYYHKAWCAPFTNQPFTCSTTFVNEVAASSTDEEVVVVSAVSSYTALADDTAGELFIWQDGDLDHATVTNAKMVTPPLSGGDDSIIKIFRKVYLGALEFGGGSYAYAPVRIRLHDKYGNLTSDDDGSSTATFQFDEGVDSAPVYTNTRKTMYVRSRTPRLEIGDYDDDTVSGGRWGVSGVTILYTTKGRRS